MQASRSSGFRKLKVIAKVQESDTITSFHLSPLDASGWSNFEAGQFLVFKIPVTPGDDGPGQHILRNYSVSSAPDQIGCYRISVKREISSCAGVPDGLGSCYLHDHVQVGDVLMADGPRGEFVLDRISSRPVVLLSGGVGLTPLVSMLHALATQSDRRTVFVHACENGAVHALGDEVRSLAASRSGVTVHVVYRCPTVTESVVASHHGSGVITRETLQALLPIDDYEFYLCGPPAFMKAIYALVRSLGIARERIAFEFFGPATVLDADLAVTQPPTAQDRSAAPTSSPAYALNPATAGSSGEDGFAITFRKSGISATWAPKAHSLLAFAESLGLAPEFSCRSGICGTCRVGLLQGSVSYFEDPLDETGDRQVLLCCARPAGPLVLDL